VIAVLPDTGSGGFGGDSRNASALLLGLGGTALALVAAGLRLRRMRKW